MSMESAPFTKEFTVGYSDTFCGREVRPTAMMSFLEETAAEHCGSIGRDIFSLLEEGGGWVLTGGGMRMKRYPRYGEEFRIETWLSSWQNFSGIREYRVISSTGSLLGEAGGRWVFWDMGVRRPTVIPKVFKEKWHRRPDSPYRRIFPDSTTPSFPGTFGDSLDPVRLEVRRGDVDLYGHLHNTTYMDWLLEAVPADLWSGSMPMEMGLRFFGEARLGDSVAFHTRPGRDGWLHEVYRVSDRKLLVRGSSRWSVRAEARSA